jgi:hypothetical protein
MLSKLLLDFFCIYSKEKKQHGGGVGGKGEWKDVDDGTTP